MQGFAGLSSITSEKTITTDSHTLAGGVDLRVVFMIGNVIPIEREETSADSGFDLVYEKYFDMVYRICYMYFHGIKADTEDAVQTVFMKYLECSNRPEFGEHIKAWLIVTAKNTCKTMLRSKHRSSVGLDEVPETAVQFGYSEALHEIMKLPEKERVAVVLCYYEQMTAAEAAKIIGCRENTVYSHLHRAKKKLMKALGD